LITDDVDADPEVMEFANSLFQGVVAERLEVDKAIGARLANWTIGRLAVVDRALLRLGTYEIMCIQETPPKVVINEYIELAKLYGSEVKTARLVNGVLDRIAREHRSDEITRSFEKPVPMPTPSGGVPVLPE
jgi:N utilization substance protein B